MDDKDPCWLKPSCVKEFMCGNINRPLDYDALSPFVILYMGSGENKITVGNESYPKRRNTAIIKSMEYGYIDKPQVVFEIFDEAGGELGLFVKALRKCGKSYFGTGTEMRFKFGWIRANCHDVNEQGMETFEGFIRMIIAQIDISFSGGMTKYTITGHPLDVVTTNQRQDDIKGGNKNGPGMRLVDAIKQICNSKNIVPIFAQHNADGSVDQSSNDVPWEWEGFGKEGPIGNWQGDNKDVLSAIAGWIEPFRIKHGSAGAGIVMVFDSKDYDKLYLWKNPNMEVATCSARTLGTFIVNGARCSPVLRFDPKFNFLAGLAGKSSGGTAGGSETGKTTLTENNENKTSADCPEEDNSTGNEQDVAITQPAKENYAPNEVHKETLMSNIAHIKANMLTEFRIANIQGDLVTMGMPYDKFVDQTVFFGAPCSVVVLNPFFIRGDMNSGCGDWMWLANTGCNDLLSDKNYICRGINHSIKEGSYTTTLQLMNVSKTSGENIDK